VTTVAVKPQTMHQQCIEVYLRILDTLAKTRNHPEAKRLWGWMRTAKMFEVGNDLPYEITQHVLNELAAGLDKDAKYYDTQADGADAALFQVQVDEYARKAQLPDHRPFDCMWLSYGYGNAVKKRTLKIDTSAFDHMSMVGHLITPDDDVWSFVLGSIRGGPDALTYQHERIAGIWDNPSSGAAWLVPWVLEFIDSHGDLVTEYKGLKKRRDFDKESKKLRFKRPVPPPYYMIKLANHHYEWRPKNRRSPGGIEFERSHRYDRAGHWRHLVKRGPGRPDLVMAEDLRRRGWQVYERMNIPPELEKKLLRKGHRSKRPDEWMAVKEIRVVAQHKIPYDRTDLPYKPASRNIAR